MPCWWDAAVGITHTLALRNCRALQQMDGWFQHLLWPTNIRFHGTFYVIRSAPDGEGPSLLPPVHLVSQCLALLFPTLPLWALPQAEDVEVKLKLLTSC